MIAIKITGLRKSTARMKLKRAINKLAKENEKIVKIFFVDAEISPRTTEDNFPVEEALFEWKATTFEKGLEESFKEVAFFKKEENWVAIKKVAEEDGIVLHRFF